MARLHGIGRAGRLAGAKAPGLLILLLALGMATLAAQARPRHGNLFDPQNLGLLEGPDRDAWQQPGRVMDALGISDGSTVADLGAGGGWFTVRIARRVGPNGLVYAEDVQRQMIESIDRRVRREGFRNVRTVLGTYTDPKLPPGVCDAVLIVDAYHEVEDRVALLGNVRQALAPNGRLGIVEFRRDGGGPGPDIRERVDPAVVIAEAQRAGLHFVAQETFLPYQYLLIFGR